MLQAIGEGEVKKTGYFDISVPSHDIKYGKQWAVLKSTGLMQFFHKAEPKLIGFLQVIHILKSKPSFCSFNHAKLIFKWFPSFLLNLWGKVVFSAELINSIVVCLFVC